MSATKESGVISGLELGVGNKCIDAARVIFSGKRKDDEVGLKTLDQVLDGFLSNLHFEISVLRPKTFTQFLELERPTQSTFNQLASELKWQDLFDQVEEACFFNKQMIEKAKPLIEDLWRDEVAQNPFQPPEDWRYLPVEEAVILYQHLLGSNLKVDATLDVSRKFKPDLKNEGIAVWPKLTTLARIFNVSGNPLEDTEKGRKAYAKTVELFIPKVGEAYTKAYPKFSFKNWREGHLTANYVRLTPAGRKAWQKLEQATDDDFVIAPAFTGKLYAGYSVRRSRIEIVLSVNQMPQDCIMAGSTIAIQPDRFTRFEDLGIDCPANSYSLDADGGFSDSLYFDWCDGELLFDYGWAYGAYRHFGSAGCFG